MINDEVEESIFLNLIRNGQGLTKSCMKMGYGLKVASIYLQDEANFALLGKVENAFKLGLIDVIEKRETAMKNSSDQMLQINMMLDSFISNPIFWGDGLNEFQKEELEDEDGLGVIPITDDMILEGLALYGNLHEVSTAYSLEYKELLQIVVSYPKLKRLIRV